MRILKEIPHSHFKITLFGWNEKYILKIEAGPYEQVYKVKESDFTSVEEVEKILNSSFLQAVEDTFRSMHKNLQSTIQSS